MLRLAAVALLLVLAGCASGTSGTSGTKDESAPPASVAPKVVSEEARRERIYLEATAAHLCSVQSRVYTDPAEMAAAYGSKPRYSGLTDAEVAVFDQRRVTDEAFAAKLADTITATCPGPTTS